MRGICRQRIQQHLSHASAADAARPTLVCWSTRTSIFGARGTKRILGFLWRFAGTTCFVI
jgi:hypothetical protein